mgnify:CR=1 FL=1
MSQVEKDLESENYTRALANVTRTLEICPESAPAKIKHIEVLAKMGNTKTAVDKSREYLTDLSHHPDFLYIRGLALCYDGQS